MKRSLCQIGAALAIIVTYACISMPAAPARAQTTKEEVKATPKGSIGLGLFGAEVGLLVPGLSRLNQPWSWAVFPLVGAAGGTLTGYFVIDKPGREKLSIAALVTGMAFVVPALMVTVNAGRHSYKEDPDVINVSGTAEKKPSARMYGGVLLLDHGMLRVGLPELRFAFRAKENYPQTDRRFMYATPRTSAELTLVSGLF